jgi:hypothetical protein
MREDVMQQPEKNVHLRVPPELAAEMEAAARAENKTPDEWATEAFAEHLESQRWRNLVAFGHEHARKHGFKEEDVARFIAESREERKRER